MTNQKPRLAEAEAGDSLDSIADTTIDGEVEKILTDFSDGLDFVLEVADDAPAHDKDFFDRPYKEATQAITNLIAQEANKARIDGGLDELYGLRNTQFDKNRTPAQILMTIDNRINALTADKEQADA